MLSAMSTLNPPTLKLAGAIPSECEPRPLATQVVTGVARFEGRSYVLIQVATGAGVSFVFLPPDVATTVGDQILNAARNAAANNALPIGIIGADAEFSIKRAGG